MTAKDEIKDKRIASEAQRIMASNITQARKGKAEWDAYEKDMKAAVTDTVGGDVDLILVTETGDEVLTIVQSDPSQTVNWSAFRKDHPELEDEIQKYLNPATSKVTFYTKWVEQLPAPTDQAVEPA